MLHTLYAPEDIARLNKKARLCLYAAASVAALLVCAVAVLLRCTNAYNERATRLAAEVIAVTAGWAAILLLLRGAAAKKLLRHTRVMLDGPVSAYTGVPGAPGRALTVPGATEFRPVTLRTEKETLSLRVHMSKAPLLPREGARVRVRTVHGFITAWEEDA